MWPSQSVFWKASFGKSPCFFRKEKFYISQNCFPSTAKPNVHQTPLFSLFCDLVCNLAPSKNPPFPLGIDSRCAHLSVTRCASFPNKEGFPLCMSQFLIYTIQRLICGPIKMFTRHERRCNGVAWITMAGA